MKSNEIGWRFQKRSGNEVNRANQLLRVDHNIRSILDTIDMSRNASVCQWNDRLELKSGNGIGDNVEIGTDESRNACIALHCIYVSNVSGVGIDLSTLQLGDVTLELKMKMNVL